MDSPRNRLILGIAAVAVVLGLCVAAVWSVRGRLPAQAGAVAVAPAADAALRTENLRLQAEVARLTAERDAALANARPVVTASPIAAPPAAATAPVEPPVTHARQSQKSAAPPSGDFTEPQTFSSASTSN
jgi:hypothetical protein